MNRVGSVLRSVGWELAQVANRIGIAVWVALALMAAIGLFHLLVLQPQQRQIAEQRALAKGAQPDRARVVTRVAQGGAAKDQSLERFYKFFRNDERQADVIARLTVAATELGLTYRRFDYRMLPESNLRLGGFQVKVDLAGAYPEVRNFVSTVLTRMPTMTLDQIEVTRRKDGASGVDAQLQFSYHYSEDR